MNAVSDRLPTNPELAAEPPPVDCEDWRALLAAARGERALPLEGSELIALYGPLCSEKARAGIVVAHLAQSLDGRIATENGVSRWLSGDEDLLHTHRMRALADAVVVGVNTVLYDDPQLTVRRCPGKHPVRVVIDPERRLDGSQRVFRDPVARTLLLVAEDRVGAEPRVGHAEVVAVNRTGNDLDPNSVLRVLAERGLKRIFVEGGGTTVSRFLQAGALDRLQLTIAPVILGSGRPAVSLPQISDLRDSLRPVTRQFRLGADTMIECVFHG
jgi:diaminohydroxyphosphoribosylaminopyrimidine deaminase/5-amino-6-(5-phosphoribosylamino)uracil reductase